MYVALYTQYFPESCEKNHRHFTRVGFKPKDYGHYEQEGRTVLDGLQGNFLGNVCTACAKSKCCIIDKFRRTAPENN